MTETKTLVGGNSRKLLGKLHNIMTSIESIPKRGWNKKQSYHYATEADVLEAFRKELIKENIFITSSLMHSSAKPEGWGILTTVNMAYTIYDLDSDESLCLEFAGQGMDGGDKGIYKAYTGANKYFLLKTFWLPTYEDPENDSRDSAPHNYTADPRPPQSNTKLATDREKNRLGVLVAEKDVDYSLSCEIDDKIRRGILTLGEAKEYATQLKKLPKLEDSRESK